MPKNFKVVVTIDKKEISQEEKERTLARYLVLLHKWNKQEELIYKIKNDDGSRTHKNIVK